MEEEDRVRRGLPGNLLFMNTQHSQIKRKRDLQAAAYDYDTFSFFFNTFAKLGQTAITYVRTYVAVVLAYFSSYKF